MALELDQKKENDELRHKCADLYRERDDLCRRLEEIRQREQEQLRTIAHLEKENDEYRAAATIAESKETSINQEIYIARLKNSFDLARVQYRTCKKEKDRISHLLQAAQLKTELGDIALMEKIRSLETEVKAMEHERENLKNQLDFTTEQKEMEQRQVAKLKMKIGQDTQILSMEYRKDRKRLMMEIEALRAANIDGENKIKELKEEVKEITQLKEKKRKLLARVRTLVVMLEDENNERRKALSGLDGITARSSEFKALWEKAERRSERLKKENTKLKKDLKVLEDFKKSLARLLPPRK